MERSVIRDRPLNMAMPVNVAKLFPDYAALHPGYSPEVTRCLDVTFIAPMRPSMRTTLTIDDDLVGLLKRRARELGVPLKDVVNQTLRAGLRDQANPGRHPGPKTIPHAFGFRPGIDLDKLNQLADELEVEAYAVGQQ
jgi:hypothetical protein